MKQKRLLALTLSLLLLIALFAGCSAKSMTADSYAGEAAPSHNYSEAATEAPADMAAAPPMSPEEAGIELDLGSGTGFSAEVSTQKIIYSGVLQLETTEFDAALAAVDALVTEFGGFIESSNNSGYTTYDSNGAVRVVDRHADYTLRVPSDKFQSAMTQVGAIGNVTNSSTSADNITSQYIDSEARRDALLVQEERLLSMLEKTEDVESLIELESRLSEVRYELESIERQLRNWQTQVNYSTINLYISEVEIYTPTAVVQRTFSQKLSDAASSGWASFVYGIQNFAIGIVRALPGLVLFLIFAVVIFIIVRKILRKRSKLSKFTEPPKESKDEDTQNK